MSEHDEEYALHRLMGLCYVIYEARQEVVWGVGRTQEEAWKDARMFINYDYCIGKGLWEARGSFEGDAYIESVLNECCIAPCTKNVLEYISAYGGYGFPKFVYLDEQGIWCMRCKTTETLNE